ncbi:MAG: response regulator transcription factor [Calditrichia bacterium]
MSNSILIIDDDAKLNELLKDYLKKYNFEVKTVTHPLEGLRNLKQQVPDLVILDVMLPDMDGFEVCREIRKDYSVPVIMLTARGEVTDRIVGLELGADDYLPKPFEPRELVARIQAVLRRGHTSPQREMKNYGPLSVDFRKHAIVLNGEPVDLTSAEFELLAVFIEKAGKVLDRNYILDHVRGIEWEAFDRSVDVLVSRLRQKLKDDPKNPHFIKTIWGTGYMFIGEETDEH